MPRLINAPRDRAQNSLSVFVCLFFERFIDMFFMPANETCRQVIDHVRA